MKDQKLEIGKYSLKVLKTISEGGFGIVYLVENIAKPYQKMALKKIITQDEERCKLAMKELKFLQNMCNQPSNYLISYFDSNIVDEGNSRKTFHILIEFGPNGTLFDLMGQYLEKKQRFSEEEILNLMKPVVDGLVELHKHKIIHCDIKIENLLFFNWNTIKMCDFGSVSKYDIDCSKLQKSEFYGYESKFEKQTTLMYRPPEMCDMYLGYKINTQVDMWMLGCVFFTLMFFKHPFNESSKLSIVNASFFWPEDSKYSEKLESLVRNLLTPNPDLRPTAANVQEIFRNWDNYKKIDLNEMAKLIKFDSESRKGLNFMSTPKEKMVKQRTQDFDSFNQPSKGNFDFSGLDKWSKTPKIQPKTKPQPVKNENSKFNNFNFMNFNFNQAPSSYNNAKSNDFDSHLNTEGFHAKANSHNNLFDFEHSEKTFKPQTFGNDNMNQKNEVVETSLLNDFDNFFGKGVVSKEKVEQENAKSQEFDPFTMTLNK